MAVWGAELHSTAGAWPRSSRTLSISLHSHSRASERPSLCSQSASWQLRSRRLAGCCSEAGGSSALMRDDAVPGQGQDGQTSRLLVLEQAPEVVSFPRGRYLSCKPWEAA